MIISGIKYCEFTGNLTRPIRSSRKLIKTKPGFIIRLENNNGLYGFGEAAPLAGFSNEYPNDVAAALYNLSVDFKEEKVAEELLKGSYVSNLPSLRFAIEQAVHQISLKETGTKIETTSIPTNYLIGSLELDETIEIASMAYTLGWRVLKMKLAVKPFEVELKTIEKLQSVFPDIKFRFDMNGAWSFSEAVRCMKLLNRFNVEYIEQPVDGLDSIIELAGVADIPVAPDESIQKPEDAKRILDCDKIDFLVVKPMKFGFNNTLELIEAANRSKKQVIVSTLFESNLGLTGLMYLASKVYHDKAHGIHNYLAVDKLKNAPAFTFDNGAIELSQNLYNFDYLSNLFR